jgi:hypothetical protein
MSNTALQESEARQGEVSFSFLAMLPSAEDFRLKAVERQPVKNHGVSFLPLLIMWGCQSYDEVDVVFNDLHHKEQNTDFKFSQDEDGLKK